jgi:hypothetical protein
MKTSLDFDQDEFKFQPKMTILELVFAETKQAIGFAEFDLGGYANKSRDTTVKKILDLKSDKFPGCQIYIYINIQLLDELPKQGYNVASTAPDSRASVSGSVMGSFITNASTEAFDPNANANEIRKK